MLLELISFHRFRISKKLFLDPGRKTSFLEFSIRARFEIFRQLERYQFLDVDCRFFRSKTRLNDL